MSPFLMPAFRKVYLYNTFEQHSKHVMWIQSNKQFSSTKCDPLIVETFRVVEKTDARKVNAKLPKKEQPCAYLLFYYVVNT